MRRLLAVVFAVVGLGALGAGVANSAPRAQRSVTITVRFTQGATYQYPAAAISQYAGGNVDRFIELVNTHSITWTPPNTVPTPAIVLSTTLRLYAVGTVLGFPSNTYLGTMKFTYQLHGSCGTSVAGCSGTTNLETLTTFPGGTISAGGSAISLAKGLNVPVSSGTGIFKGVTGMIAVAPGLVANSIYRLTLASS